MDASTEPAIPMTGLLLWLRADAGVTSKSGLVSRWADQSTSHTDATQDSSSAQPRLVVNGINGRPALLFDGTDDFLELLDGFKDLDGAVSVFTAVEMNSADYCSAIFEASNGPEIDDISLGTDHGGRLNFEIYNSNNEDVAIDVGMPAVYGAQQNAAGDGLIDHDGAFATGFTYDPPAQVERSAAYVGKTLYANCQVIDGMVGELLVYRRALTIDERRQVENYLAEKFACCANGS
jgi:hypothetical protein